MTESVIQDMLSLIKTTPHTRIDAKKFYAEYRIKCAKQNVLPIKETYYFYKSALSYKKNLRLVLDENGNPFWVFYVH